MLKHTLTNNYFADLFTTISQNQSTFIVLGSKSRSCLVYPCLRISVLRIFPLMVLGSSSTNSITLGYL